MLQRSYVDYEYESLYSENSVLRQRVRKMSEIQPYVELLLQNNKKYQDDIKDLQIQNNKLRGRVDSILEETLLLKQAHKNQLIQIKSGFESDIERLIRQLKDILRDKQAMQEANKTLIEELSTKSKKDLDSKKRQLQQLEIQSNRKIVKLNEALKNKQKLIEDISQQFSFKQNNLIHEIDELSYKINLLTKDKEHMAKQIDGLNEQKKNLTRKNKQLLKENEQISTKWLKSDQQKSESLLQMKNKNIQYSKNNSQLQQKLRFQERVISEQNRKNGHLIKQCDDIMHLKNQIQTSLRRTVRSLQDLKAQHSQVVSKLELVSKTTQSELKKQGEQLQKLSQDNKKLNRENIEIISQNKDKVSEIQDLIRAIEKLERKIADLNQKCAHLQQENLKKSSDNKTLTEKLEDALLQKKSLNEKVTLYSNHNLTLQEMLEKQKRRNACLETSRFQIQTIAMGALSKPEEICREYEREIEKIVQQFLVQKQQIESNHKSQILHLKLTFEQALKQKDEYFARKIAFLEKQMISLRSIK